MKVCKSYASHFAHCFCSFCSRGAAFALWGGGSDGDQAPARTKKGKKKGRRREEKGKKRGRMDLSRGTWEFEKMEERGKRKGSNEEDNCMS